MTLDALREKFRNRNGELNETHHIYLTDPRRINDMKQLAYKGGIADRYIAEAKALIETMEAYKMLLHERAQQIATAPYHAEIHLIREKRWRDSKVVYRLEALKVYDSDEIKPETIEITAYPGTERHKAIKAFNDYQKTHPGIIAVKDIEKGRWE